MVRRMESKNICPICLRINRKLKVINSALSEYHDELTNYTLAIKNYRYCSDCECLLRKTYNFQQKCTNAAKILKNWINETAKDKTPANLLYQKLPPISLTKWTSENNKVINYTCADSSGDFVVIEDHKSVKPDIDTLIELNTSEQQSSNVLNDGNIGSPVHCENIIKMEFEEMSDKSIQNFNNNEKLFIEFDTNNIGNKMQKLTKFNKLKQEDDASKLSESVIKLTNVSNNESFNIDTENKDLELVCFSDDDNKHNIIAIDDENEYSNDASLGSDDDSDDDLHSIKKRKMKKELLDEISDEDLDYDYISKMNKRTKKTGIEDYSIDKLILKERSIISKLENINETLDSICENWEVTSLLTDLKTVDTQTKEDVKKMTHTFLTEKNALHPGRLLYVEKLNEVAKIKYLNADIDMLTKSCGNIVQNYKIGLYGPKERLTSLLKNWGKLKTEGGFVFDKTIIINRLNMISGKIIQRLLNLMHGKKRLHSDAARVLKMIQKNPKQLSTQFESVFDIEYLSTEKDKLEEFERRKTYECYVKAEYKCQLCYQGFKSEKYLEYHKKMHDEKQGQFSCHICYVRHYSKEGHRKHMLLHKEVFKCKLCPLVTYYRDSMINHYEQHKGTIYECGKCGNNYKSRSAFMFHQSRAHPRGDHVCSICGNAFVSEQGLHSHVLRKHRGESPVPADGSGFSCEECTLTFPSEEACLRHRRITHGVAKRRRGITTVDKGTKETKRGGVPRPRKLMKPRKKPVMTCPECNAVGESYGWLVKHFNIEHPSLDVTTAYGKKQVYLCDICGKEFGNKYGLRDHIGVHTGLSFPCPTCNKQFGSQQKLNQHRRWHGPPGYCCERCGKKFHSASNLNNHMRTHIGERSFKCQICGKGFLHRCSLNAHIRGVHNHQRRNRKRGDTNASHEATDTGTLTITGISGEALLETRAGDVLNS